MVLKGILVVYACIALGKIWLIILLVIWTIILSDFSYGDLTPKSILGRVFAMIWILIGMCIFSVFTATLTAALASVDESRNTISGRTVMFR